MPPGAPSRLPAEGAPAYADMTVAAFLEFIAAMHG